MASAVAEGVIMAARTVVFLMLLAGACSQVPGLDEHAGSTIGQDVDLLRKRVAAPQGHGSRMGWQEKTYQLDNGHWVYVEPDRRDCEIHYEVNGGNLIVGYTPVGSGCRYQ